MPIGALPWGACFVFSGQSSVFQSVVCRPPASGSPGIFFSSTFLGHASDLLNKNLYSQGPGVCNKLHVNPYAPEGAELLPWPCPWAHSPVLLVDALSPLSLRGGSGWGGGEQWTHRQDLESFLSCLFCTQTAGRPPSFILGMSI